MQMRVLVLSMLMAGCLLVVGGAVTGSEEAEEMCVPMGIIILEPPESVEAQREAVEFHHSKHFSYACNTCHHKWDIEAPIAGCTTSGCHDLFESPAKTQEAGTRAELEMRYYKNAYHDMCIGCHKKIKAENEKLEASYRTLNKPLPQTGPTGCHQCHPKD